MLEILTEAIQRKIEKYGGIALIIFTTILALDYFNVYNLNNFHYSIRFILWGYLILNVAGANIIKLLRNKNNPHCPKCESKLLNRTEYECTNCGKLEFGV